MRRGADNSTSSSSPQKEKNPNMENHPSFYCLKEQLELEFF
jgi:hypothetical protein